MRHPTNRPSFGPRWAVLAVLALLGAGAAGAATLTDSATETYRLGPEGSIALRTTNGDILVSVWDRPEVQVETLRKVTASSEARARELLDGLRSEERQDGERLEITARLPRTGGWGSVFGVSSASITYVVSIPAATAVEARSTNGDVTIEGAERRVHARTTNGQVRLREVAGEIEASTTNGGVIAELVDPVTAASLSTTNGRVRLTVAEGVGIDLDARAVNGRVRVDVPIRHESQDRRGKSVRGELWGGGAPVSVRTVNGSISVQESR
ncbi:MAG TPA: DUF4097 family beta strand repeat-containing protein [Thermoanaerobaculia bacterium]|nr:DUF4097 family beta strand repeat-containing protein [Thermoanaerobaculia bacterium]